MAHSGGGGNIQTDTPYRLNWPRGWLRENPVLPSLTPPVRLPFLPVPSADEPPLTEDEHGGGAGSRGRAHTTVTDGLTQWNNSGYQADYMRRLRR